MAHNWQQTETGETDLWAYNPYGAPHRGPLCTICGLKFCIECNPEFLETSCEQFQP